jgi:hypothetical protein
MKMNWFEYWIGHCWMSGWQSIRGAFRNWADLLSGNYADYALLKEDDPFTECLEWFWVSLGEDNTYPREYLEYLYQLSEDVSTGKVETFPITQDLLGRLDDLVGDLIEK